jgi:hypothetical protein
MLDFRRLHEVLLLMSMDGIKEGGTGPLGLPIRAHRDA